MCSGGRRASSNVLSLSRVFAWCWCYRATSMSSRHPPTFGPYSATNTLGTGAASTVWLANADGQKCAVKQAHGRDAMTRLLHEARLLRNRPSEWLPNYIAHDPKGQWLAMEYIEGRPIDQWAAGRTDREISEMMVKALHAVGELHQAGVVHGDLKPQHLLVSRAGDIRLVDLGTAGQSSSGTLGSPGFISPEILQGESVSERGDLFALGGILYRMLTGKDPFEVQDITGAASMPLLHLPIPPSTWRPGLHQRLQHLCLTLLARNPNDRPKDAATAASLFASAAEGPPARWVVGMTAERMQLSRCLLSAQDGSPTTVCMYGPSGSGRRTLITEVVEAGKRLRIPRIKVADVAGRRRSDGPALIVARTGRTSVLQAVTEVTQRQLPILFIIYSVLPQPSMGPGVIHITPPPFTATQVGQIARHMRVDPATAEDAWSRWAGHPGAILSALRAALPTHDPSDLRHLSKRTRHLLDVLRVQGPQSIDTLSKTMGEDPQDTLDHLVPAIAEGLVQPSPNGAIMHWAVKEATSK